MNDKEAMHILLNKIAITLQNAIAILGFMPDFCGDTVRSILEKKDDVEIVALGCCIDACVKHNSWDGLTDFAEALETHRKKFK